MLCRWKVRRAQKKSPKFNRFFFFFFFCIDNIWPDFFECANYKIFQHNESLVLAFTEWAFSVLPHKKSFKFKAKPTWQAFPSGNWGWENLFWPRILKEKNNDRRRRKVSSRNRKKAVAWNSRDKKEDKKEDKGWVVTGRNSKELECRS